MDEHYVTCFLHESFTHLRCYAVYVGSDLLTFQDSLSVSSSRVKQSNKNARQQVGPYFVRDIRDDVGCD
jgi:hypothetical protein